METTKISPVTNGDVSVRPKKKTVKKDSNKKTVQIAKKSATFSKKPNMRNKSDFLTTKQIMAIQSFTEKVEKGGNINLGEILIEAGYSKNTAKTPQKVFGKEIVKEGLKKIGLDPAGLRIAHEFLLNSREIIKFRTSISFAPEIVIQNYEEVTFGACIAYYPDEKNGVMVYEMAVPNDKNIIKALEMSYRNFPPERSSIDNDKIRDAGKSKRIMILADLAKKKGLLIKKPIHLDQ